MTKNISVNEAQKREDKLFTALHYEQEQLCAYVMYYNLSNYIRIAADKKVKTIPLEGWILQEYPHLFTTDYVSRHFQILSRLIDSLYDLAKSFDINTYGDRIVIEE